MTAANSVIAETLIFIVDDEPMVAELVARVLTKAGYQTRVFHDPFLVEESDETPDVLITDYRMPGMNGIELMDRCRQRWPRLKTVVFSGTLREGDLERTENRPEMFLAKPCDLPAITKAVATLAGSVDEIEAGRVK